MSPQVKKWLLWGGIGVAGLVLLYLIFSSSGADNGPALDNVGGVGGIDLGLPFGTGTITQGTDGGATVKSTSSGSAAKAGTGSGSTTKPVTPVVHVSLPTPTILTGKLARNKIVQSLTSPADKVVPNPEKNRYIP